MIIVNGVECRNLQQQVVKNTNDIAKIKAGGTPIKLYSHNYCGVFRCTFNSNGWSFSFNG